MASRRPDQDEDGEPFFTHFDVSELEEALAPAGTKLSLVFLVGIALATSAGLAGVAVSRRSPASAIASNEFRMIGAAQVSSIDACHSDELGCPAEWLTGETGGFLCRSTGGCMAWAEYHGPWPAASCPDQCSFGNTPIRETQSKATQTFATDEADVVPVDTPVEVVLAPPVEELLPEPADGAMIHVNREIPVNREILTCEKGEATCPDEWNSAKFGGYYCRQYGGCSPWSKDGGAFPPEVCADQCSIGNTPSTRTTIIVTTTIVTTTYPGQGVKLLCFSLGMAGYEMDILSWQREHYAGIFACDDFLVLSYSQMTIGPDQDKFDTTVIPQVDVGVSKDGTAGNALQFMKAWEAIKKDGRYQNNDWVVKVDPDAVVLADRLRIHLSIHTGGNVYVRNCNKPMDEGTMMFGALEAVSKQAMDMYFTNFGQCWDEVPWQAWGEDLFMMRCLEHIGGGWVEDFGIIQDGVCNGVWCGDNYAAAFHPMKSVDAWEDCWNQAVAAR